jgi:hypothetical protein
MKIDLSTIFMLTAFFIPGLIFRTSRNRVVPRSLLPKGATEEIAELAGFALFVHIGLFLTIAAVMAIYWRVAYGSFCWYRSSPFAISSLRSDLRLFPVAVGLLSACYALLSFLVAYLGGFIHGGLQIKRPFRTALERNGWTRKILNKMGIDILEERPLSYEVFKPGKDERGNDLLVFLELRMRDNNGFYIGQLSKIGIVPDEEAHKPIYLEFAKFRATDNADYETIEADGLWLDLADTLSVTIKQLPNPDIA